MQSDPGMGPPHTGGNDDEVWRDLVSRLEEADDAFMDAPADPGAPVDSAGEPGGAAKGKGVVDFDPLGVWQQQSEPPSRELAANERRLGSQDSRTAADDGAPSSLGPRDFAAEEEGEEFVPAELPSLRNTEPAIMLSWISAAGGPLFLVFSAIFWRQIPMMLVIAVIMAFLAGTGYLLFRLPSQRDHDSGDGAVV